MRRHSIRIGAAIAMISALPAALAAQDTLDTGVAAKSLYRVEALGGMQWFDKSAALNSTPFIGMRVSRPIGRFFSAGLNMVFGRPGSKGEYFPWNRQVYFSDASHTQDTTLIFQANQRVTLATYGADAGIRFGGDKSNTRFRIPEVTLLAGAGFWSLWLDPERTHGNNVRGGLSFSIGGGLGLPVGRGTTIGLRIDDVILTNYYRNMLSLHDPLFFEDLFANPTIEVPAAKSTVHNPRMTIAFSFVPGVK